MRNKLAILIVAAVLPLTQPMWGIHDRAWAQEDRRQERLENAKADLHAVQTRLQAAIEAALQKGDEDQAAEAKAELEKVEAHIRELAAHAEQIRAQRQGGQSRNEHPEIAAARDQLKHLLAAHGHLQEGGFPDMAEMVARRAEEIKQSIARHEGEHHPDEASGRGGQGDLEGAVKEFGGALRQLREEVRQLREEVTELRGRRERREPPEGGR